MKAHQSHLFVSVRGSDDVKARSIVLGHLTAAIVEASPSALAVTWSNSDAIFPAKVISSMVPIGSDSPPIMLCVTTLLARAASGTASSPRISGITRGLSAFGYKEIEATDFEGAPQALNGVLLDMAAYLINTGSVFVDGDTVGPDVATKWTVRHETSRLLPPQIICRLYVQ